MIGETLPELNDSVQMSLKTANPVLDELEKEVLGEFNAVLSACGVGDNYTKSSVKLAIKHIKRKFQSARSGKG